MNKMAFIYKGAIHIHTDKSDGSGNLNDIVKAAKKAALDWIIITDHNYFDKSEGIINGVYVIKGEEISPDKCNHYLALNIKEKINPEDNPQIYVDKVREQGGFGFSAHPDEGTILDKNGNITQRKNLYHCIPWTDKNIIPDGIEIWNWFSNWADNFCDKNLINLAYAYLFKHNLVDSPSPLTLSWWDKLNNESDMLVPAIGGVDAHALKINKYIIPVTIFPYETCFKTITNIVTLKQKLSKDFETARQQILNAIKSGNNTIVNMHHSKYIPDVYVTNMQGTYFSGESIHLDDKCSLHFESKCKMKVCLIYNGNVLKTITSDNFVYKITKCGKYRVEAQLKGKSFLYTNPFIIK